VTRGVIAPGATIGVLGSGQLGRMFAIAARRMGYRVHTFSPYEDSPTGQIADLEVTASYEDLDALRAFARQVSVVTLEFENIPLDAIDAVEALAPVRPGGAALHMAQQRVRSATTARASTRSRHPPMPRPSGTPSAARRRWSKNLSTCSRRFR
jgi:5-(carboxyamino)imidazole ribonucleotide synthase